MLFAFILAFIALLAAFFVTLLDLRAKNIIIRDREAKIDSLRDVVARLQAKEALYKRALRDNWDQVTLNGFIKEVDGGRMRP